MIVLLSVPMPHVVLGLGTNLEPRLENLAAAVLQLISQKVVTQVKISEVFESEALLLDGSPAAWRLPYLNAAISGDTTLAPLALLNTIKELEKNLGRQDRGRWAPREIDIDILAYDDLHLTSPELNLPHKSLLDRPFAWWPLLAVAPQTRIPSLPGAPSAAEIGPCWANTRKDIPCRTGRATHTMQQRFVSLLPPGALPLIRGPLPTTELVGILNITPDSFSDGGVFNSPIAAAKQARVLFEAGANILDIGGESTRPGAAPVNSAAEWQRLEPVLQAIRAEFQNDSLKPQLSIDTRRADVAAKALNFEVAWINDVTGFEDPALIELANSHPFDLVVMHSLSIPPSKEKVLPRSPHPVAQIRAWAEEKLNHLARSGVNLNRVILDPGIGFGKSAEQSWQILGEIEKLLALPARILIGHSRKSFLGLVTEREFADRDPESAVVSGFLAARGVHYLRVHDVATTDRVVRGIHSGCT